MLKRVEIPNSSRVRILIAIPCYNEEVNLNLVLTQIKILINKFANCSNIDLMVFNDGSTDSSISILQEMRVNHHSSMRNQGLGKTFQQIVQHALIGDYDYLLTCDADNQFPVTEIEKLLQYTLDFGPDVVTGSRFLDNMGLKQIPFPRRIGNYLVRFITFLISGKHISDVTCGLRCYSKKSLMSLQLNETFSYTIETIIQIQLHKITIDEIPIEVIYFKNRESTISNSLISYGKKTLGIALRILFRKALARFSKLVALTFPIGLILITLFINFSLEAQKFQGNLYLAFSGASIITISLISAVIHLIVVRIDNLDSKIDILNKQYLINNAALCRLCVTYKK